jgi:hypothetical protein
MSWLPAVMHACVFAARKNAARYFVLTYQITRDTAGAAAALRDPIVQAARRAYMRARGGV